MLCSQELATCPYPRFPQSYNHAFPVRSFHNMVYAMCHAHPFQLPVRWGTTVCSKWMTAVYFIRLQTQFAIEKLFTLDEARNSFPYILVQIHLLHQRICYTKFVDLTEIYIWYQLHKSFVKRLIDKFDLSCV